MRSLRTLSPLLLLVPSLIGCSDSGGKPDAFVVVADAKPDAPPPPPGCDFAELRDSDNDGFENTTANPEDSGLTFAGMGPSVLCGKANSTHFEAPTTAGDLGVVDVDSFKFTVPDGTYYITMYGAGLETLVGNFRIWSGADFDEGEAFAEMHAGHTSMRVGLTAGTYRLDGVFLKDAATTSDIPYKIRIVTEAADARCVPLTTGGYVEAEAGTAATNDMILWDYDAVDPAPFISFTPGADAAEATAITAAAGMSYHLSGNSANSTAGITNDYKDADTFKFTTGPTTTEVTIRMKFPTTTADVDVLIAAEPAVGETDPDVLDISNRLAAGPSEEILTTAVEPNTVYWLWIAGYKDHPPGMALSTAATYDATICSAAFVGP